MNLSPSLSPFLILVSFTFYGLLHSLTASNKMKAWARKSFGSFSDRFYRILYILFALISFVPVYALVYFLPDKTTYTLSSPWSTIFNIIRLFSALMLLLSVFSTGLMQFLGLSQAAGNPEQEQLKTTGLYKYVRHPIYTFTNTFFWFSPILSLNTAAFYIAISLYSIVGAIYEERKLVQKFGQAYRDYQATTPMLIPFLFGKK